MDIRQQQQHLLEQLTHEEQLYECLVQLLNNQREMLLASEQQGIEDNLQQQERCMSLLQTVSQPRQQLVQAMGQTLALEISNLSTLLPKLPDLRIRLQIQALQHKINGHVQAIRELNQVNQALLAQARYLLDQTLEMFGELARSSQPPTYSYTGVAQTSQTENWQYCSYDA